MSERVSLSMFIVRFKNLELLTFAPVVLVAHVLFLKKVQFC